VTTEGSGSVASDLLAVVRQWCQQQLPGLEVEAAERLAEEVGRQTSALVFELAVVRGCERGGYTGPQTPCVCGAAARFVSYRGRWVRSVCGEARVERAYYHCAPCHTSVLPWDAAQGLTSASFTPRLKARVARLCARLVYGEAQEAVEEWSGLRVANSTLQDLTAEVGGRLRAAEDARTHAWFQRGEPPPAAPLLARVVGQRAYLSIDAAKAHVEGSWHDVKVATFSRGVRGRVAAGDGGLQLGIDVPQETQYLAVREEAAAFAQRLYVWALGLGAERAQELVVLGDGAEWIWKLVDVHFSDAVQILDFYHASEKIWEIARAAFGPESEAGQAWAEQCSERLAEHGPPGLLQSLRELRQQALTTAVRQEIAEKVRYFRRHRRRLRYPEYRAQGMMIGSGPVEAACKVVVGQRLKGAGMRWSQPGSDAVLAVRTAMLSGRYDQIEACARAA
jgi:hypothetical protein